MGNDGLMYISEPDKRGVHTWKRSQTRKNPTQKPLTPRQERTWLNAAYYIDAFFKKGAKCPNWGEGRCTPELMRKIERDIGWTEFEMKKSKGDTYNIGYVGMNESRDQGISYLNKYYAGLEKKGIISDFKLIPNNKLNKFK
jgi:hypothetical protein